MGAKFKYEFHYDQRLAIMSRTEIGKRMGISAEMVRRIEVRALKKLQKRYNEEKLMLELEVYV